VAAPRFFLGAMSPYSWFTAERIDDLLADSEWHGIFLGGVFKATGRSSWGFGERRKEGMAECEARAERYGLGPIRWPNPWPTNDLTVARAMAYAAREGRLNPFTLAAMRLAFLEGGELGEADTVLEAGRRAGLDAAALTDALSDPQIKAALREQTDAAVAQGVFGVPTVIVDGDAFWGDDRLEEAAAAAARLSDTATA
jgi:2-hydroxychromene-2-carboxylate isomerase